MKTAQVDKKLTALLFIAHGSSKSTWSKTFNNIIKSLNKKNPKIICQMAFLEKNFPDFNQAVEMLLEKIKPNQNININVIPLFFAGSIHTNRDIPKLIDNCNLSNPTNLNITFTLMPALLDEPNFYKSFSQYLYLQYFE